MLEFIRGLFSISKKRNDDELCNDFQDINDDLDFYANQIQKWYRNQMFLKRNNINGNLILNRKNLLKKNKKKKKKKNKKA